MRASHDRRLVLFRGLVGRQAGAVPGRVDAGRFFRKHVLARLHRRFQVRRPEAGRGGQQHQVHVGVFADAAVSVQAGKDLVALDRHAIPILTCQGPDHRLALGPVQVRGGDQPHVFVDVQRISSGPAPAAATANHRQVDCFIGRLAGRPIFPAEGGPPYPRPGDGRRGRRSGRQKLATIDRFRHASASPVSCHPSENPNGAENWS